ncbi:MAG: hypothetical protein OHK0046_02280 [Anaerolineae bacterium]
MVTEVVLFRILPEFSPEEFLAAAADMQPVVSAMPGFIDRELLHNEEGQWIDIVHWNTLEEAHQAAHTLETAASAGRFMQMIDVQTINMMHLHPRFTTA